MKRFLIPLTVLALIAMAPPKADALITLTDANSVLDVDALSGAYNWIVDGVDELYEQQFYVRTAAIGGGGDEFALGAGLPPGAITETIVGGTTNIGIINYNYANLMNVQVTYILTGGTAGTKTSDVAESIRIINQSGGNLTLSFFQYCDFDLGWSTSDALRFPNANAVTQRDLGGTLQVAETVATPAANRHEGGAFPTIVNYFGNGVIDNLSNLPAIGAPWITGDMTWAFQWDRTIVNNGTFLISKDKRLAPIPEPATVFLMGAGLVGVGIALWRRKKA